MNRRTELLHVAVDEFNRVHDKWVAADNRPNPDETYWDAVDKLLHAFTVGDIPDECRELANAVAEFAVEVEAFDEREDTSVAQPDEKFWAAREKLAAMRSGPLMPELPPLESIKTLDAQKVSHAQIALIYGLRLPNGELAAHLVQRELDNPGSVIGPDWADPRLAARQQDRKASASVIQSALQRKRDRTERKPCPETPRDLWEQKVSVEQSAYMLVRPREEVQAMFDEFDRERKEMLARRARQEALGGPLPEVSGNDIVDEIEAQAEYDIDQEIVELYREGHSQQQIKEELKVDGRKVAAVIRAYQARQVEEQGEAPAEEEAATA